MKTLSDTPLVSVVIPAWNEAKNIHKTLQSISKQTYKPIELIVVDNNSTDETGKVAKEYGATVYVERQKGVSYARQRGFTEAKGELIISTDADTLHPTDWVERIVTQFQHDPELVGLGGVAYLHSGPQSARLAAKIFYKPFIWVDRVMSGGWNLSGFCMAVRKDAFLKTPGFDTSLHIGEDIDMSEKLRKVGKVRLDMKLMISVSGRRYKDGFLKGIWDYVPHFFTRVVFGKARTNTFKDVRD